MVPDLNPIEQRFAKLIHRMRNAQVRNFEDTRRKLGDMLHLVSPDKSASYIANAGHGSVQMSICKRLQTGHLKAALFFLQLVFIVRALRRC
ncbi:hypothetical protein ABIE41_000131 [Bosea sp. OAE506]|uniref:hypothetical protein n=1 Tax=Bosea sp. OAE506 TaxID=2663870 RepID=UPI00178C14D2